MREQQPTMSHRKEGGKLLPHGMCLANLSATATVLEWALKCCGAWYWHFPSFLFFKFNPSKGYGLQFESHALYNKTFKIE